MKQITIRIKDELYNKLTEEHEKLNISKNAYINILLNKRKVTILDGKRDIVISLSRIGNNLNQLTKLANSNMVNVVDTITTDENEYIVEIVKHKDEVEQVIYNDNVDIDIEIEKRGFIETQGKDNIYYDFKNIHNNSNVPLDNFTWIDVIPTDVVRIDKVYTGTWNEDIFYSVYYKTNKNDYKQFIENLDSRKVYQLDFKKLALENDEYINRV